MFQNMPMTSLTNLSDKNEIISWENRPFTTIWPEAQQQNHRDTNIKRPIKKKSKRFRTSFTTHQLQALEKTFAKFKYITSDIRKELSQYLNIGERPIKIWFQNRRMKEKRDSSESSCDSSSDILSTMTPALQSEHQTSDLEMAEGNITANYMAAAHMAKFHMSVAHKERMTPALQSEHQTPDSQMAEGNITANYMAAAQMAKFHMAVAHKERPAAQTPECDHTVESLLNQNKGNHNIEQTETSQYQLPNSYYNSYIPQGYQFQYPNVPGMVPNMHFLYDTNVYPSQYYPNDVINYSNACDSQYTLDTENYPANNICDLSYF